MIVYLHEYSFSFEMKNAVRATECGTVYSKKILPADKTAVTLPNRDETPLHNACIVAVLLFS